MTQDIGGYGLAKGSVFGGILRHPLTWGMIDYSFFLAPPIFKMDGVGCGYDPQILYKPKIEYKTPTPAQRCEVGD